MKLNTWFGGFLSTLLAGLVAVILGFLLQQRCTPSPKVEARVVGYPVILPNEIPDLTNASTDAWRRLPSTLPYLMDDLHIADTTYQQHIETAAKSGVVVALNTLSSIKGIWDIQIKNKGSRTAESVTLAIPRATIVKVTRDNGDIYEHGRLDPIPVSGRNESKSISLGTIHPGETLDIIAWTQIEVGEYLYDEFNLQLADGQGEIHGVHQVNRFLQWIDANLLLLVWFIPSISFLVILLLFSLKSEGLKPVSPETSETGDKI